MSRILTPKGWRELNESVKIEKEVLTEDKLIEYLLNLVDKDTQLDELSKKTLKNYLKKSRADDDKNSADDGDFDRSMRRGEGQAMAKDALKRKTAPDRIKKDLKDLNAVEFVKRHGKSKNEFK